MGLVLTTLIAFTLFSCKVRKTVVVKCPTEGASIEVDGEQAGSQQATFRIKRWANVTVSAPNYVSKTITVERGSDDVTEVCLEGDYFDITSNGESFIALTKITENARCYNPFGGNSKEPLFFSYSGDKGTYSNICRKDNPLSNAMTQMTEGKNNCGSPTYSKANGKIAFGGRLEGSTHADIYMMNASHGKAITQVTNTPNHVEAHPDFSPDGKLIVYSRYLASEGADHSQIWIKNLENGENSMLGSGRTPSFSHNGKKIVYAENGVIGIMDIDGDHRSHIVSSSSFKAWCPRFSPDDRHIVFHAQDTSDNWDIYVIDIDGNNLVRLTFNKSTDNDPYWADDGNIYFRSDRGDYKNNYNIWRFKYQE